MKSPTNHTFIKWIQILGVLVLILLLSLFDGVIPVDNTTLAQGFTVGSFAFLTISIISILLYLARAGGLPLPTLLRGKSISDERPRGNTRLLIFSAMIMAIALLLLVIGRLQML